MIKTELSPDPAVALAALKGDIRALSKQALNRAARNARSFAIRRTSEVYNLSTRQLQPYLVLRRSSQGKDGSISASLGFRIRAIPIEQFKPRIEMRQFTVNVRGRPVRRRLATVLLQLYRAGSPKLVAPAFPLRQRTSGRLRPGEAIRRRIGPRRDRLTRLRYFTFPQRFLEETLLPQTAAFAGENVNVEFDRALRRDRNTRGGARTRLSGNA